MPDTCVIHGPVADALAQRIYARTQGQAFEPRDTQHPEIIRLIAAGYLRRTDGRCGFERFKDSHVAWTPAGHVALGVHPHA